MTFNHTDFQGLVIIEPKVFGDDRGYFYESYNQKEFEEHGIIDHFIQDNQSRSTKNTVRGLHFQTGEFAQSKLVRVLEGEVYDVVVDLRPDSATFKKWFGLTLSAEKKNMMYIPRGFAHGFCVTSDTAEFAYKVGFALWNKVAESGIIWNDPGLNIDWPVSPKDAIVSEKDQQLKKMEEVI